MAPRQSTRARRSTARGHESNQQQPAGRRVTKITVSKKTAPKPRTPPSSPSPISSNGRKSINDFKPPLDDAYRPEIIEEKTPYSHHANGYKFQELVRLHDVLKIEIATLKKYPPSETKEHVASLGQICTEEDCVCLEEAQKECAVVERELDSHLDAAYVLTTLRMGDAPRPPMPPIEEVREMCYGAANMVDYWERGLSLKEATTRPIEYLK